MAYRELDPSNARGVHLTSNVAPVASLQDVGEIIF